MPKKRPQREGIMLAYPVDEGRVRRLGENFFIQPKINGERAKTVWFHGEPVLISSYGNEFKFLDHIKEELKKLSVKWGEVPFDGEIYVHGWPRERIDSALRRTVNISPEVGDLEYHIFDICSSVFIQTDRFMVLGTMHSENAFTGPLRLVSSELSDQDRWRHKVQEYLDAGYEGGILRNPHGFWIDKRSVNMLKYKPTEIDEYEIVGYAEAISEEGNPKGMLGSFFVRGDDMVEFKVGAGKLVWEQRKHYWENRGELTGKTLVVKHEPIKTSGGVPICAVAVEVKEE